ncbi:MAG: allophanate hydrolase, partial [Solirubrobacterales bacterium]|nr:allophanate hydrolase [Solirubrobacterales bacterium]
MSVGVRISVGELLRDYRAGAMRPSDLAADLTAGSRAQDEQEHPIWITRVPDEQLVAAAEALEHADPGLPLYGVPFAVKDNIDVAGMPTTAGCPGFARVAERTAPVVQRLLDAGALLVGKTNMDQFATGLAGTRSPYGACSSVFDIARVSGGSSSGSALSVATGVVAFALGTDTAGSGRVPAAFNALVGVKPTRGLLSTRGVLPACASLDCVSLLTRSVADAARVFDVAAAFDPHDRGARREPPRSAPRSGRVGVPLRGQAEPEEAAAREAWARARRRAGENFSVVPLDVEPLLQAAPLLYAAWVAERTADLAQFIDAPPAGLDPTVARIISGGACRSGIDVFEAMHRLAALRAEAAPLWEEVDALLLPTAPSHPTHSQVAADPVGVNERLGRFTNFVNLMDMAALALPGAAREDRLPFGITLLGPAFADRRLLELGAQWSGEQVEVPLIGTVKLAVAGAHMSGLPLNHQLTELGARLIGVQRTAPVYRLYALPSADLT